MNVWQHLDELRRRLLICIYAMLVGTAFGAWTVPRVTNWLAKPVGQLVFIHPTEAFAAQVKIAVGVAFLICLPLILYQAWAFISTGLKTNEKRYLLWSVPLSYLFFIAGFSFSTFIVFPKAVGFLLLMKTEHLTPMLSVEAYLDFFALLGLAFGILFQLPMVLHFLAKVGVLKADLLVKNRRVSYLAIFVLATIFNPVPEVFTQLLLAVAAIALFELSIALVRWETRKKAISNAV